MDSISKLKAVVTKIVAILRVEETQRAMTKDERARYIVMLGQGVGESRTLLHSELARRPRALVAGVGRFSCHGHDGHDGHP